MGKFNLKHFVLLGLWLFLAQGTVAFAFISGTLPAEEAPEKEFRQTPAAGAACFEQIHILEVQPAPQKERPDILAHGSSATSVVFENQSSNSTRAGFYLQDHRNTLRQLIFPFHFHW